MLKLSHIVLHPSSVKNQRFLPASPQGEAFWALPRQRNHREINDNLQSETFRKFLNFLRKI